MKKSLKKTVVVMAALALSTATAGICELGSLSAKADVNPLTSVSMVEGASVRVGDIDADKGNGMRFTMQMAKSDYETLMTGESYSEQEFGIIIVPNTTAYEDVSYDTVFGAGKKYDWAVWQDNGDGSGQWVYTGTADDQYSQIMLYSFDEMYNYTLQGESENNVYVRGTISKIQKAVDEYRGIGYVKYLDGDEQKSLFLDGEVRSMTYVAQRTIENDPENTEWLKTNYVDDYVRDGEQETATTVTQEYYYEQSNGQYVIKSEETEVISTVDEDSIYINDEVSADSSHKSGYVYYPEHGDSVQSGKAYANGRLTLKSYYKLFDVANVIDDVSLIKAKRTNYSADAHASLTVAEYGEKVSDRLNSDISRNAQYKIDLPKKANALGDASVALNFSSEFMSKSALREMIAEGYDSLSFYAYRQLDMGATAWENGVYIRTLDFDKMRAGSPKVSDSRKTIETNFCATHDLFDNATNTWRKIEYSLTDLLEFYDVLFANGSNYYIAEIGAGTSNVDNNVLYCSKFALNNIDVSDVVSDSALFNAKLNNWWVGANHMNTSGLTAATVEDCNQSIMDIRSDKDISKNASYKIALPKVTSGDSTSVSTMISLSREFLSKAVLQKLVADGYKTLDFSVYRALGDYSGYGLYVRAVDFDKMRNPQDKTTDTNGNEVTNSFKNKYYSEVKGGCANRWVSVSYNLSDLIEFYDVLFAHKSNFFICEISAGAVAETNNYVYISAFEINK